ncbi:MAG TPA: FAD:protein FMN transferase [Gallionellaceae bacterium]|nr:FAD:protein FMN transferase [Gallionellaceae bacterium]
MNITLEPQKLQQASTVELVRARPLLGTIVEISACGCAAAQTQAAIAQAFAEIEKVHALMSYHDEDSDVSRINREAFDAELQVDVHTWRVLRAARLMAEASNGVFDISVARQLTRLGFLPDHAGFPKTQCRGDWRDIVLLPDNRVRLACDLSIDLSGIAKGYAVDLAIQALSAAGMSAGRVNAGGDLRVFGAAGQHIHVRDPAAHTHTIPLLELTHGAAATSAGYYSERLHQGHMVTPIIHPHRKAACESGRSVTVLAKDCMTADALTKVVYANPRGAAAVLKSYKARALIVEHDPLRGACHIFDSQQAE